MNDLADLLRSLKVIPVLTVASATEAVAASRALRAGGIKAVEITLRTPAALEAINAVKEALPDFTVAAGTVKSTQDIEAVAKLGVDFAVSPGLTQTLSACATEHHLPFLPGIATPSELLCGLEWGRTCFKLFPAEAVGGLALLKSLVAPFAGVMFCPTGGIGPDNYRDYLHLPNVACVGGSWMVTPELINGKQWERIETLSRECMAGAVA